MNTKALISEGAIALVLIFAIAAIVVVVIVSGPGAIGPTGLRDLAIGLAGALAGVTIRKLQ